MGTVCLVEDDPRMRESLRWMLEKAGFEVAAFASGAELLNAYDASHAGCLVLDWKLPGISGLELQDAIEAKGYCPPFVLITGYGAIPTAVSAMRQGAVDVLEKPFSRDAFIDSVRQAVERDASTRGQRLQQKEVQARLDSLTPREAQVLRLVTRGMASKKIGGALNISAKTVEVHRANISRKMHACSVAELVAMVSRYAPEFVDAEDASDGQGE